MAKNFKNKKAFSLIELSVVILIIGIIIAGVTQSSRLIRAFKLSSARTLTASSPVGSIKDLSMWLEATGETSFDASETEDADLVGSSNARITNWYDINPTSSTKHNAAGSSTTRPSRYAGCINNLPCLRFVSDSSLVMTFDGTFLVGSDYTIFVVEQRRTASANYFLGDTTATSANLGLSLGYSGDTTLRFGHLAAYYPITVSAYTTNIAKVHSFINSTVASGSATFAHYLNGSATASTLGSATGSMGTLTAYANAAIGRNASAYYSGDIGEIIIFSRALKAEERTAVEDYLLKKWGVTPAT